MALWVIGGTGTCLLGFKLTQQLSYRSLGRKMNWGGGRLIGLPASQDGRVVPTSRDPHYAAFVWDG